MAHTLATFFLEPTMVIRVKGQLLGSNNLSITLLHTDCMGQRSLTTYRACEPCIAILCTH